jgi:hypothetical protein
MMSSNTPPPMPPVISGGTPAERFEHLMLPATLFSVATMRKNPVDMKEEIVELTTIVVADFLADLIDDSVMGMAAYIRDLKRGARSQPAMCPLGGCLRDAH